MSAAAAERIALWLVWCMAPAATLIPLIYAATARWYRSLVGRAFMVSATGLMLLVDLSLTFRAWDGHIAFKQNAALCVYVLILVGLWLTLFALVREQVRRRRTTD